jgi:acyl-CoA thioesterase-2
VAFQNEQAIFTLAASFQVEEPGFEHQDAMPEVAGPEGLLSEGERAQRVADRIPLPLRARALGERPIESRPVDSFDSLSPRPTGPVRHVWYKTSDALPDDPALHRYLLAYASDFNFLGTAMQPHAVSWLTPGMQVASLDHAMWFHRPFRMDDWVLHAMESPSARGARGLVRGRFFDRAGNLVASTAQEGLMRKR